MPIQVPVIQTGLEKSIQQAAQKAGKNLRINMGPGAKSIESLSRPLGNLTGKTDEFTKSMEAANARVLAFGASVGVIAAVSKSLKELVTTTIAVEKSLANINSILQQNQTQLNKFKDNIFNIARNTEQTFDTVAEAALELSRQGLKAEEVTKRLNDALVLSRLSGLSAADSVAGLTAAINSFSSAGITSAEVLNKISAAAASAAVSDRDLIEGLKRSGAVAVSTGVEFDQLIGIISALQERTARGGAVIGNSLKTIFTRLQDVEKLGTLRELGVQVTDAEGRLLSANKVIENLAPAFAKLDQASRVNLADNLVGKFQIAPFLALLEDYNLEVARSNEVAQVSFGATNEAYKRNEVLNKTLAAAINTATVNLKELANTLGEIGVTENLSNIIGVFNNVVSSIQGVLDGDGIGSKFAKGLIKGIGGVLAGPGLALALVAIGKLLLDFAKFGAGALKTFFGLNTAAQKQAALQGQIAASLLNDKGIRSAILSIEKQNISEGEKKKLQTAFFTKALNEQLMVMQKMQGIARTIAPGVMAGTASRRGGRAAGGFLPIGAESSDISRGVGGAPSSAKPVVIPNFAFGGGKRGTMVANDSEYIVPNYANGGDAIFNQNMASSMGLPANARKVRAAGGYIPNYAKQAKAIYDPSYAMLVPQKFSGKRQQTGKAANGKSYTFDIYGIDSTKEKFRESEQLKKSVGKFAIGLSKQQARTMTGGLPNAGKIDKLANQGSIGGLAGAIFETAISALIKSPDFDLGETASFDFIGKNSVGKVSQISPSLAGSAVSFLEAKIGLNSKSANSMANKIARFSGSGGKVSKVGTQELLRSKNVSGMKEASRLLGGKGLMRSASGYIPNFADPLQDAIGREQAAGLPISQIRINQSGKLRNAQNPMGIAVTNTRDEPTGAIPNYAVNRDPKTGRFISQAQADANKKAANSTKQVTKANRDYLGMIFAVQAGLSGLSAATSDSKSELGEFTNILSDAAASGTSFIFAGMGMSAMFANAKGSIGKFGRALGPVGIAAGALVGGFKLVDGLLKKQGGQASRTSKALAELADSSKNLKFNFDSLSEVERAKASIEAKGVLGRGALMTSEEIKNAPVRQGMQLGLRNIFGDRDKKVSRKFGVDGLTDDPQLKKGFEEVARKFILLGASADEVDVKLGKFGAILTGADLGTFFGKLKERGEMVKEAGSEFEKGLRGEMKGMDPKQKKAFLTPLLEDTEKFGRKATKLGVAKAGFKFPEVEGQRVLNKLLSEANTTIKDGETFSKEASDRRKQALMDILELENKIAIAKAKSLTPEEIAERKNLARAQQAPLFGEGPVTGVIRQARAAGLRRQIDNRGAVDRMTREQKATLLAESRVSLLEARKENKPLGMTEKEERIAIKEIQGFDQTKIEEELKTISEERLKIIQKQRESNKLDLQDKKNELEITKDILSKEERILELIEKKGVFGAGFAMGFGDIPSAEDSTFKLAKTLGDASKNFAYTIGDSLVDAIAKGENLGDALLGAATNFLNIMSKALMEDAVNNVLRGMGGSDGIGGFLGSLIGKQGGGAIRGGSGTKDDVPAMLMGGEFVMNKKAVSKYGMGFMSALNNGAVQGFANGGIAMPGFRGAGAITGKEDLMSFATQSNDPGLGNLTMFGRRRSKLQQRYQGAKEQAFGLAVGQMRAEQQAEEQGKANKKAFKNALLGVVISAGINKLSGSLFGKSNVPSKVDTEGFTPSGRGISQRYSPEVTMPPKAAAVRNAESLRKMFSTSDKNLIEELGEPRFPTKPMLPPMATGGSIPNTAGVDTVPAMLSGGEFVMNAAATQRIGAGNLAAANAGVSGGDSSAGLVSKMEELIKATQESGKAGDINITVNGSNGQDDVQTGEGSSKERREFADKIKTVVKQVITDEKRLGGQLRK